MNYLGFRHRREPDEVDDGQDEADVESGGGLHGVGSSEVK